MLEIWLVRASDGRYVTKANAWTGSPKVEFELGEREDAVRYLVRRRAEEDAQLFNGMKRFRHFRRAVVRKYGELTFIAERA